jgi:bifunctional ADP-heptose synthase (sugar kinase/adenylyltransferase)
MKILVIGESCRDVFNYGECNRLCPEAPVPIFNLIETTENGGMALNVKNNISALNVTAELITNKNWKEITKTRFIDIRTNHMFMRLDCNDNKYERYDINNIDYDRYDAIVVSDYNNWCKDIKYIKINEYEYRNNKEFITDKLEEKIITTLGPKGSVYKDAVYSVPKVEIKDVAGAGDSFIAGLAVKYIETNDIISAIQFANDCATQVVQRKGVSIV